LAQYYSAVHRCDETVGALLYALAQAGRADKTLVMFLSDNGMAFPFAKTNVYLNSTCTPWLVRWPGHTRPGSVDREHMVSGIDLTPTVLDAASLPPLEGMDGHSMVPLLNGEPQAGREEVMTVFHETSAKRQYPMRSLLTPRYGYIFNAWADGETVFKNESQSGLTFKAMQAAAERDDAIAARVKLFLYRVPEELYDYAADPDALHNLIDDPGCREQVAKMRAALLKRMRDTEDPLADTFAVYLDKQDKDREPST